MEKIKAIYTNPGNPGGFAGPEILYREVKKRHPEITKKQVQKFLESSRTYTLFKNRRLRFVTSKTIPYGYMTSECFVIIFKYFCRCPNGSDGYGAYSRRQ